MGMQSVNQPVRAPNAVRNEAGEVEINPEKAQAGMTTEQRAKAVAANPGGQDLVARGSQETRFDNSVGFQAKPGLDGIGGDLNYVQHPVPRRQADPNFQQNRADFGRLLNTSAVSPIAASQLNTGNIDQVRGQQMDLYSRLKDQANGIGPSLAQAQLQQATDQNMQQALAMAASARGSNPAIQAQQAAFARAQASQQSANQAAQLRMQEQMAARQQMAGLGANIMGQDANIANANAAFGQQANIANQGAQQYNRAADLQTLGGRTQLDQSNFQNGVSQDQFAADLINRAQAADNGVSMASNQAAGQLMGATMQGVGSLGASLLDYAKPRGNGNG